ncbi:MAG TPA: hypothetical protein VJR89_22505 [Polyangiales bacterium]|nr:hypothetical protein [Polyangiales bacterium]
MGILLAAGGSGLVSMPARADALVAVQLKDAHGRSADGTVTLLDAEGKPVASCEARGGSCEMKNVAGGKYWVTVKPVSGEEPKARKVMIPPSGKVTLVVTSG